MEMVGPKNCVVPRWAKTRHVERLVKKTEHRKKDEQEIQSGGERSPRSPSRQPQDDEQCQCSNWKEILPPNRRAHTPGRVDDHQIFRPEELGQVEPEQPSCN